MASGERARRRLDRRGLDVVVRQTADLLGRYVRARGVAGDVVEGRFSGGVAREAETAIVVVVARLIRSV